LAGEFGVLATKSGTNSPEVLVEEDDVQQESLAFLHIGR
jgi:hypothetical protein